MNHFFVAGFDFGTSYSKVVLRDQLTSYHKVVTFGRSKRGLLPSFVWSEGTSVKGPFSKSSGERLSYLKLLAADAAFGTTDFKGLHTRKKGPTPDAKPLLVRYFLTVLQGIRKFIRSDPEWNDYNPEIDLLVIQLAVPSGLMHRHDSSLEMLMRDSLMIATIISDSQAVAKDTSNLGTLSKASSLLEGLDPASMERLRQRCIIYPEVAAAVQTVLRSQVAPDGKYIMMDVGAGTVDLNAFYRLKAGGGKPGRLNYWACEVAPLGCAHLRVLHAGAGEHERVHRTLTKAGMVEELERVTHLLMRKAFKYQPLKVQGTGGGPWSHGTHAYVCGGGASNPIYTETLQKVLAGLKVSIHGVRQLPCPENFELPSDVDSFGRFAVAYGLSFHVANLDTVKLPIELKTFEQAYPITHFPSDYPDSCSCGGLNQDCRHCDGTGFKREKPLDDYPVFESLLQSRVSTDLVGARTSPRPPARPPFDYGARFEKHLIKYGELPLQLAKRLFLLVGIANLVTRPELKNHPKRSAALKILSADPTQFKGEVTIITGSATLVGSRMEADVILRDDKQRRLRFYLPFNEDLPHLVRRINQYNTTCFRIHCRIFKTPGGEFTFEPCQPGKNPTVPRRNANS